MTKLVLKRIARKSMAMKDMAREKRLRPKTRTGEEMRNIKILSAAIGRRFDENSPSAIISS